MNILIYTIITSGLMQVGITKNYFDLKDKFKRTNINVNIFLEAPRGDIVHTYAIATLRAAEILGVNLYTRFKFLIFITPTDNQHSIKLHITLSNINLTDFGAGIRQMLQLIYTKMCIVATPNPVEDICFSHKTLPNSYRVDTNLTFLLIILQNELKRPHLHHLKSLTPNHARINTQLTSAWRKLDKPQYIVLSFENLITVNFSRQYKCVQLDPNSNAGDGCEGHRDLSVNHITLDERSFFKKKETPAHQAFFNKIYIFSKLYLGCVTHTSGGIRLVKNGNMCIGENGVCVLSECIPFIIHTPQFIDTITFMSVKNLNAGDIKQYYKLKFDYTQVYKNYTTDVININYYPAIVKPSIQGIGIYHIKQLYIQYKIMNLDKTHCNSAGVAKMRSSVMCIYKNEEVLLFFCKHYFDMKHLKQWSIKWKIC